MAVLVVSSVFLSACGSSKTQATIPPPSYGWIQYKVIAQDCADLNEYAIDFGSGWSGHTQVNFPSPTMACTPSSRSQAGSVITATCPYNPAKVAIGYAFECQVSNFVGGSDTFSVTFATPVKGAWQLILTTI